MTFDTSRLCALSDGIYAIVITILVFDLKAPVAPQLSEAQLVVDLEGQIPNFLAYIVSFSIIAAFWTQHHALLHDLTRCNRVTLGLNFVHVLFLGLIPFTASLVGRYEEDRAAVTLFAASLGLAGASLALLRRYVEGKREWLSEGGRAEPPPDHWLVRHHFAIVALTSIGLSLVSLHAALLVWLVLPVMLIVARR
jgi:uncharacterized membrane protein